MKKEKEEEKIIMRGNYEEKYLDMGINCFISYYGWNYYYKYF